MDFLNSSFRLFTFAGIAVRVHILYLVWMAFRLFQSPDYTLTLTFLLMLFAVVLMHEFGHCFGARAVGGDAENILMWPLGGLAYANAPMTPWAQFVTVACGPLVNVGFCVVAGLVLIVSTGDPWILSPNPFSPVRYGSMTAQWQVWVGMFYFVNYMLLCFNMLPVFPFDGGQLLRTAVWPFIGLSRATVISAQLGLFGAVLIGMWGISIGSFILVGIAIFGGITSYQHLQAARYGMMQEHFVSYDGAGRHARKRSWWSRRRARREAENPNPGGWEERLAERERAEAEVDRILQKVHEQGIGSLSYVERQRLERATRERQQRDRELNRGP